MFKPGDEVIFTGCDKRQRQWGENDDPNIVLYVGQKYIISDVEVHSWHTKVTLEGIKGQFNSACFEDAN